MKEIRQSRAIKWITIADNPENGQIDTVWYRRRFCSRFGEKLEILISACSRYKLYVNGRFVTYGPCKGGDGYQFFDSVNLTEYLIDGENELLAEVVSFPDVTDAMTQVGGPDWAVSLMRCAALAVIGETDSGVSISTGDSDEWQCYRSAALEPVRNYMAFWLGYTEKVDLSKAVRLQGTEKLEWQNTKVCDNIDSRMWGELSHFPAYERPIAPMEIGEEVSLSKLVSGLDGFRNGCTVIQPHQRWEAELDAGEELTAFVHLSGSGGKGASIRIRYAEAYYTQNLEKLEKGDRLPGNDRVLNGFADEILLDGRDFDYSPYWFRTFRFLRIEVETGEEALSLYAPGYCITRYPLKVVGHVKHDDSGWIEPIWQISLRTLRNCMHETFEDCPYYEQMQYTMDTRLQMLFAYRVGADVNMAKRTLFDYHASRLPSGILQSRYPSKSRQVIPAFALHWIFMLYDYYMQTGDSAEVRKYFGTMDGVLGYFRAHRNEEGLVENVGYWAFIDWVDEWQRGIPEAMGGPEGNHNFLYAYALGVAADLCKSLGLRDLAQEYESERKEILSLADAKFYDAERGLYRYNSEGNSFCQHTQVWAVLAGVRDAEFRRGLMERVDADSTLLPCSFPMQYPLFRAYECVGLYERTEKLWGLWKEILNQNLTTIPETPKNARSDCHAWGALLLYEYPAMILGVKPAEPGWRKIRVRPEALFLETADGRACVPDGYIDVKWSVKENIFQLECELRTDRPVCVELPNGRIVDEHGCGKRIVVKCEL